MTKKNIAADSADRNAKGWRDYERRNQSPIARFMAEGMEGIAKKLRTPSPSKLADEIVEESPIEEVIKGDLIMMAVTNVQEIEEIESPPFATMDPIVVEVIQSLVDEYFANNLGGEDEIGAEDFVADSFTSKMESFLSGWDMDQDRAEGFYRLPEGWEALVAQLANDYQMTVQ